MNQSENGSKNNTVTPGAWCGLVDDARFDYSILNDVVALSRPLTEFLVNSYVALNYEIGDYTYDVIRTCNSAASIFLFPDFVRKFPKEIEDSVAISPPMSRAPRQRRV